MSNSCPTICCGYACPGIGANGIVPAVRKTWFPNACCRATFCCMLCWICTAAAHARFDWKSCCCWPPDCCKTSCCPAALAAAILACCTPHGSTDPPARSDPIELIDATSSATHCGCCRVAQDLFGCGALSPNPALVSSTPGVTCSIGSVAAIFPPRGGVLTGLFVPFPAPDGENAAGAPPRALNG